MKVIICADEHEVGRVAADEAVALLAGKQTPVLGFATGSSPLRLYEELARRVAAGELDLRHAAGYALDEYVGIEPTHPLSYRETIRQTVIVPLGMDPARVHVPDGMAEDLQAAADRYDAAIAQAGGVDVQILGIGSNGHIGFNEPSSSLSSRTRVKALTQRTRSDNARFFDDPDEVPSLCVTQGLGTIMDSRCALMVVTGEHKADAVAAMIEGPVSAACPASVLQFHRKAIVVIDEASASKLQLADYYRRVAEVDPW
ncbi:MAG: glucosamine-6-phosphate deaminase [Arachnia propionica]|nr:MAG: glucosamine-6-phosphate deaminase [Arachnia propionica]